MIERRRLGVFVLVIASFATNVAAQGAAHPTDGLQGTLSTGQLVAVTDRLGQETVGRVAEVSASVLTLQVAEVTPRGLSWTPAVRRSIVAAAIAEIRETDATGRRGPLLFATAAPSFRNPATTLPDLATLVAPGTSVVVSDMAGVKFRGRIASISAGTLTISGRDTPFVVGQIADVKARLRDSPWNGAAIGLAVGFAVPALVCMRADSTEMTGCTLGALLLGGLPGLAIGLGADASRAREVTVFRRTDTAAPRRLTVAPILDGHAMGLQATLRY